MPKVVRALNRAVMVSNPAYFGDEEPRQLILVDVDDAGLWFSGAALHALPAERSIAPRPADAAACIFFPFAQIGYFFDPHQFATVQEGVSAADRMMDHPPLARPTVGEGWAASRVDDGPKPKRPRVRR